MSTEKHIPERQIRIIVDSGDPILCPLCSMKLDAGLGHLCKASADGIISGQTWKLNGGQQIHAKEASWKRCYRDQPHDGPCNGLPCYPRLEDMLGAAEAQLVAATKELDRRQYLMDLAAKELKRMFDKQDEWEAKNASLREALLKAKYGLESAGMGCRYIDAALKDRP